MANLLAVLLVVAVLLWAVFGDDSVDTIYGGGS